MPRSTFNAVLTPGSDSPSSTSVIATAGRMPTTTVCVSKILAIPAMLPSTLPMNESTTSSAEMSTISPRARVSAIRDMMSSCSVMASRSCMSTWIVTRRQLPMRRIGIRSIASPLGSRWRAVAVPGHRETASGERDRERVGERGLGGHVAEVDSEMHDGLRDLRANAADDALGAHQPGGRHRLQEVLRHERVDRGHPGDVENGVRGAGLDDLLEQVLHHGLGARAVEGSDHR